MELFSQVSTTWLVLSLIALTCLRASLSVAEKRGTEHSARYRTAGELLESLIVASVIVFLVVRPFVAQAFYIPSESMAPTLTHDDRVIVNKLAYRVGEPRRGEIVVFRAPKEALDGDPNGEEKDFIKRVVGLPGDRIEIHAGHIYVNGKPDDGSSAQEPVTYDLPPLEVPDGKLFVMGDNRNHSNDSHRWGALDRDRLIGRAIIVFWPPTRAGVIR